MANSEPRGNLMEKLAAGENVTKILLYFFIHSPWVPQREPIYTAGL
jgi:hypothetical protein